jgi:hypothetical protein
VRAFAALDAAAGAALVVAVAALALGQLERTRCAGEEREARDMLERIAGAERSFAGQHGDAVTVPSCTFGETPVCTSTPHPRGSRLTIGMPGVDQGRTSSFSYSVHKGDAPGAFRVLAIGTRGAVLGSVLSTDQSGTIDDRGSRCR